MSAAGIIERNTLSHRHGTRGPLAISSRIIRYVGSYFFAIVDFISRAVGIPRTANALATPRSVMPLS